MTHSKIDQYLQPDNTVLSGLFNKLSQLNHWNTILRECLEDHAYIMDHCQVVNLSGNSLIALANSPHWLTRFRFYIPDLLPKLRKYKGLEHIKAICCKAQPYTSYNKPKPVYRHRLTLTSKTAAAMLTTAKNLKDAKLKAILEKIATYTNE